MIYLSAGEAAARAGISRDSLLRAVRRGDIRPVVHTPDGSYRFSDAEVEAYARRRRRHARRTGKAGVGPSRGTGRAKGQLPATAQLRAVYAGMACGVLVQNAWGEVIDVNGPAQEIIGLNFEQIREQAARRPTWRLRQLDGSELPEEKRPFYRVAQTHAPQRAIMGSIVREDGERRALRLDAVPVLADNDELLHVVTSFIDVTAQTETEETLRRSEERFRALSEHASDLVSIIDENGIYRYASPSHWQILGYRPEALVGTNALVLVAPEDLPRIGAAFRAVVSKPGATDRAEFRIRHADGSWRMLEMIGKNRLHDPAVQGVLLNSRDVTDRERAEEELRLLAEEARAMTAVSAALASELDPSQLYELILQQAAKVLPCDHANVMRYENGWAIVVANWGAPCVPPNTKLFPLDGPDRLWNVGQNQTTVYISDTAQEPAWRDIEPWTGPYRLRSLIAVPLIIDGVLLGSFCVNSFTPNFYTKHHIQTAVAFGERVTQALHNARLYAAERKRARAAAELAQLRNDFVASVSHELRTPLTAIVGYAELLEARWHASDDARRLEQLGKIVAAAHRQQRLVEDLLMLSRLESGEMAPEAAPVLLATVIQRAADEVQSSYDGQCIDREGPHDVEVLVDADRAVQILANLLDNAAKYSPEGSPILVSWSVAGNMAYIRVRDHGPGIPEAGRAQLFTRFGRVAGSRIRAGRVGTGLGLYLGKSLAQAMGGTVELESTGPEGSTFRLLLPLHTG